MNQTQATPDHTPAWFRGEASIIGRASVMYSPVRADASRGFGAWEVHPQKVPVESNGCIELKLNGHWLALAPEGTGEPMQYYAFKPERGGRTAAEYFCVLNNGGLPTRVVDACGEEHVSEHTIASVRAQLAARESTNQ